MRKRVTILFLWFATLLWIAITIVPHHHHEGIVVFGLNLNHVDCQEHSCSNSEKDNCCNNNNCEVCPFLKGDDIIIKDGDDNDDEKIKLSFGESFYNESYKYYICNRTSSKLYLQNSLIITTHVNKCTKLRAPPFA